MIIIKRTVDGMGMEPGPQEGKLLFWMWDDGSNVGAVHPSLIIGATLEVHETDTKTGRKRVLWIKK